MKKLLSAVIGAGLLLSLSTTSFAATFQEEESLIITVPVRDDLYAVGEKISVQEMIDGDLIIAGGNLSVNGRVQGDLMAAGGNLSVRGEVVDDARVAGGDVRVSGNVGDDLIVAGGTVVVEAGSVINGDLVAMGGDISIFGTVRGMLRVYGGTITIAGTVEGPIDIRGGNVRLQGNMRGNATLVGETLIVNDNAQFGGNVRYWRTAGPLDISSASGTVVFDPSLQTEHDMQEGATGALGLLLGVFTIFSLLSGALILGLLITFFSKFFAESAKYLMSETGWSLLYGLLFLILTPIVSLLLMVTIIGFPIGLILLLAYGIILYLSTALTSVIFAYWTVIKCKKNWNKGIIFLVSLGIFIVLKFLVLIPIVGWIIKGVLILMGVGTYVVMKLRIWKKLG